MEQLSIKEIEEKLKDITEEESVFIQQLQADPRKGVQAALKKRIRFIQKERALKQTFYNMSTYERALRQNGIIKIAGIDEVGRGPLAGPVVASAVILPESFYLPGLNDSKKIPEHKRERYYDVIMKEALSVGVGIVHRERIDEINIYEATKEAMKSAVANLSIYPDHLLIDAMALDLPVSQNAIIKGDSKSISISAASIIAKVTRDRMMNDYAKQYPHYYFEKNMGYGTKEHLQAIERFGITPWHRRSFSPIKELVNKIE